MGFLVRPPITHLSSTMSTAVAHAASATSVIVLEPVPTVPVTYTGPAYSFPTATSMVSYPVTVSYLQPGAAQPPQSVESMIRYPVTVTKTLVTKEIATPNLPLSTITEVVAAKTAKKTSAKKVSTKKSGCC